MKKIENHCHTARPYTGFTSLVYILLFLVILLFLIHKTQYGFANMDEGGTYLSIPYRLCKGDTLIFDEWHVSQLSAFLVKPLMSLYLIVVGDTEGIVLSFRIIYTFILALSALFIMKRLSLFSSFGAAMASLLFLMYTPFGIMNFSYNSLGIITLTLSLVIFSTSEFRCGLILGGMLFASAVLCCPFLAIVYLMATILCISLSVFRVKCLDTNRLYKVWKWGSIGVSILAITFLLYLALSDSFSFSGLLRSLEMILDDPEHKRIGILYTVKAYFEGIIHLNGITRICMPIFMVLSIVALVAKRLRNVCFLGGILNCIIIIISIVLKTPYLNFVMLPINFVGLLGFICYRDKNIRVVFFGMWLTGMLYSFLITLSSNQNIYASSSASTVSTVASAVIIAMSYQNIRMKCEGNKLRNLVAFLLVIMLFVVQLSAEFVLRYNLVFWDNSISELNYQIEAGPEKGVITTKENKECYERYYAEIHDILSDYEVASVAIISEKAWLYPCFDREIASYSVWLSGLDDKAYVENRFTKYYEWNPRKIPDLFYIDNNSYYDYALSFADKNGYTTLNTNNGAVVLIRS